MRTFEEDDSDPDNKALAVEKIKADFEKNLVIGFIIVFVPLWFTVLRYHTSQLVY